MTIKLDFDICKGGRVAGKKIIGMRYNYKDIYSLIGNYNAYTVEITESGYKTVNFDPSDEYYYSAIDPYFDMGNGTKVYENILSYTYTTPGTYQIITSARIDKTVGNSPEVLSVDGIRRDTIHLDNAFVNYGCLKEFAPRNVSTKRVTSMNRMFYNTVSGTANRFSLLDLSNWDTSNVTNVSEMFRIDADMFKYSSKFQRIDFSGWDTSNIVNMRGMFYNNDELDEVLGISDWDTSKVIDMSEMFYGCGASVLDIEHFNTKNVTTFKDMFRGSYFRGKSYYFDDNDKRVFIPVDLSNWDTSSATDMSGMFYGCEKLTSIEGLNNWDTSEVTDMSYMFYCCYKLTPLDLSGWDTSKVTNMCCMFDNCDSLTSLDLSDWKVSNATDLQNMFSCCTSLVELDLSNWNTSKVTNMSQMFLQCQSLAELDLSGWDTSKVTNMYGMFNWCTSLQKLDINHFYVSYVDDMTNMFAYCSNLTDLDLSNWAFYGPKTSGMFRECSNLEILDIRNLSSSDASRDMFTGCNKLHTIRMDNCDYFDIHAAMESLPTDDIGVTRKIYVRQSEIVSGNSYYGSTYKLEPPTNWVFELIEEEKPLYMPGEFEGNTEITEVKTMVTSGYGNLKYMFRGCTNLVSVNVEDWITHNVTDWSRMFEGCTSLKSLDLSNWQTGQLCYESASGTSSTGINDMEYMFNNCTSLEELNLSNWILTDYHWSLNMFNNCISLHTLRLDNCDATTISRMVWQLPTNTIVDENSIEIPRTIYCKKESAAGIQLPDGFNWIFSYVEPEETEIPLYVEDEYKGDTTLETVVTMVNRTHRNLTEMFRDCTNLKSVNTNDWDVADIDHMNYMFQNCTSLEELDLSNWVVTCRLDCFKMLWGCDNLHTIKLNNWDNSTIYRLLGSRSGNPLPTNDIGRPRIIYVRESEVTGNGYRIELPAPWEFRYVD